MTVITAYKCPDTGKLFEHEEKYQKHREKVLAKLKIRQEVEAALKLDRAWWEQNFWHTVKSLAQLEAAIMLHRDVLAARGLRNDVGHNLTSRYNVKPTPIVKFLEFTANWTERMPSSHSCPHNGVIQGSTVDPKRNASYPGWQGRFDYQVQSCPGQEGFYPGSSSMWKGSRIHTGTGGGGGFNKETATQTFGYSITLWAADWPAMHEAYREVEEDQRVWYRLKDITVVPSMFSRHVNECMDEKYPAEEYLQRMGVDTAQ